VVENFPALVLWQSLFTISQKRTSAKVGHTGLGLPGCQDARRATPLSGRANRDPSIVQRVGSGLDNPSSCKTCDLPVTTCASISCSRQHVIPNTVALDQPARAEHPDRRILDKPIPRPGRAYRREEGRAREPEAAARPECSGRHPDGSSGAKVDHTHGWD
jgi:hypothetical protein